MATKDRSMTREGLDFYTRPGVMTSAGRHGPLFDGLPSGDLVTVGPGPPNTGALFYAMRANRRGVSRLSSGR